MQQADDFLDESQRLFALIETLNDKNLHDRTLFMQWTLEDIIGHLHMFNHAAGLALRDGELFKQFFSPIVDDMAKGKSLLVLQREWLGALQGWQLVEKWREKFRDLAQLYGATDPKLRIAWAGPDMSARSSITARQMETWAHGQAVFDRYGISRHETQRLRNIVHLGVNTFGWTFANRNLPVPDTAPYIDLVSPEGEKWQWNEPQEDNCVTGSALGFCQILTQTRHLDDTDIKCRGALAKQWMTIGQCFAGPPIDGPKPGERYAMQMPG